MASRALPHRIVHRLRRTVLARRRLIAAVCAALAVAAALRANAAPPPPRSAVLTAAHDLAPGALVRHDDLAVAALPPDSVPEGVLRSAGMAVGRRTVGPVRAGEPLTDVRLLGEGLLGRYPGTVAAPVRIGDAAAAELLRVGDRVTILAADPQGEGEVAAVASSVPVIAVPRPRRADPGLSSGALVVVAVPEATAAVLAGAAATSFISFVLVR